MNWRVKGLVQKTLSVLPYGVGVNDWLQRSAGELRRFEAKVDTKIEDWSILVSHMQEIGVAPNGLVYLEIGTGWFPTLPICYSLIGADRVITFDLTRHLSPKLTARMLGHIGDRLDVISEAGRRDRPSVEAAYAALAAGRDTPEVLHAARVEYRAPADASATGLPPETIDVVFSNSVLEHVPASVIERLFTEAHRLLRPGGLMVHSVNCGDHYAYFDRAITPINYLRYSERRWRFWDNKMLYQNRLRAAEFIAMAERAGFEIALRKQKPRLQLLDALPLSEIAPEFRGYPPEELCTTSIDFVCRRA